MRHRTAAQTEHHRARQAFPPARQRCSPPTRLHAQPPCCPWQVLHAAGDWKALQEYVVLLSKRRSQLKQAVTGMVRQCMGYLAGAPDQVGACESDMCVCVCVCVFVAQGSRTA